MASGQLVRISQITSLAERVAAGYIIMVVKAKQKLRQQGRAGGGGTAAAASVAAPACVVVPHPSLCLGPRPLLRFLPHSTRNLKLTLLLSLLPEDGWFLLWLHKHNYT
jgi:hypothetical protein